MSRTFTLTDDDGLISVTIGGQSATLDVYEGHNTYAGLTEQFDDAVQLGTEWCSFLARKGLGDISHAAGFAVATALSEAVSDFKKKHAPADSVSPDSPGSTGSIPSV